MQSMPLAPNSRKQVHFKFGFGSKFGVASYFVSAIPAPIQDAARQPRVIATQGTCYLRQGDRVGPVGTNMSLHYVT